MKRVLCIAIAGFFLFTACKKSKSTPPTPTPTTIPTDGWLLGGVKYTQVYCLRQESQFLLNCVDGTSGSIHSFAVFFKAYPTASGTYHVVNTVVDSSATYPGQNLAANEVIVTGSVVVTSASNRNYWSTGVENKDVTVTITGGKMKVEVPEVAVASNGDTLKLTGTMIEN